MPSEEEALELFKDAADIIPVMGGIVGFAVKLNEFINRPGATPCSCVGESSQRTGGLERRCPGELGHGAGRQPVPFLWHTRPPL